MAHRIMWFDQVMCCALAQAFSRNRKWGKLYRGILLRTIAIRFTLNDHLSMVHRSFAQAERERLATCGGHHGLRCEHSPAQHQAALDSILRQLPLVH